MNWASMYTSAAAAAVNYSAADKTAVGALMNKESDQSPIAMQIGSDYTIGGERERALQKALLAGRTRIHYIFSLC